MIRYLTSLSPAEIAIVALLWALISTAITLWLCPRLFRFTPRDYE
jgi:hypothetical protein